MTKHKAKKRSVNTEEISQSDIQFTKLENEILLHRIWFFICVAPGYKIKKSEKNLRAAFCRKYSQENPLFILSVICLSAPEYYQLKAKKEDNIKLNEVEVLRNIRSFNVAVQGFVFLLLEIDEHSKENRKISRPFHRSSVWCW